MASSESDLSTARWRKSSYSNGDGGNCVEVAALPGTVPVRDSKTAHHGGPVLLFRTPAWTAFLAEVKQGRTT
ncbi:DUF397 domain-containing protein [Streptomyces phyllanthi]|uniref:DUF397 domain-containing protein n=1 Tax=Streptomyces phyllanthi TaxID=1803180 RepID=A0A5N8WHI1_9ACTN|nr:DUF397 domain-containing protein [Streptomyces phyllanthi]MPY46356.1 DUF397 domain-containing protein [Streptomyces phyllanthi]